MRAVVALCCLLAVAGCTSDADSDEPDDPRVVQLGGPGEQNRELTEEEAEALETPTHTADDIAFVQNMIPHHEQALEMTALVPDRTERDDIPLLAGRMDISQRDEIAQLEDWLTTRGEALPDEHHSHGPEHAELMPGMLTDTEMAQLEAARGAKFDRLFLQYMIRHHEGAVLMVHELLTNSDGGQEPHVFQLAQHIDADQKIEIARMKALLTQP